jgi:hypothetical protein
LEPNLLRGLGDGPPAIGAAMSEYFRRLVKRDPPPAALIRFRCAKLHRATIAGSDSSVSEYNTIYDVLKSRGWKETDAETEWHIFWSDKDWIHGIFDKVHLDPHQHVNHYLNHYELTRKDLLVKNMKRMRRQLEGRSCRGGVEVQRLPHHFRRAAGVQHVC